MNLQKVSKQLKRNNKWIKKCAGLLKANLKATLKMQSPKKSTSAVSSPSRKKKMSHDKGECVKCGKSVSLTKEGFIHKGHSPCEGSGLLPKHASSEDDEEEEKMEEKEQESSVSSESSDSGSEDADEDEEDDEKEEEKKEA
jgi:TATA-binding protein-associated factor Taf7